MEHFEVVMRVGHIITEQRKKIDNLKGQLKADAQADNQALIQCLKFYEANAKSV